MRHGEVDPKLGWWMLEDPHMWLGVSGPIKTDCPCVDGTDSCGEED